MDSTNDISDDIISFFVDEVSYIHEIDHNPKPEDVGRIKVYASIQFSETLDPIIDISLPAKEFLDKSARYSWEQLNCLEDHERLNSYQVSITKMSLTRLVSNVMFYSVNYSLDCAMLFYMTFKFSDPALRVEEYIKSRRTQRVATFEELMPVLFDETV
ncbi:hypothetical protein V5N11_028760 [Cardamine amara subsp. amara]|uniref:Uncharacterized protein n=1 Tax=Cardamine amara subsp. amara TaxID=228776 RepID=A0ABD1BRE2_CARAN